MEFGKSFRLARSPNKNYNFKVLLVGFLAFLIIFTEIGAGILIGEKDTFNSMNNQTIQLLIRETVTPTPSNQTKNTVAQPGEHCGGNISSTKQCISGYYCKLGRIPDAGGICVVN